MRIKKYVYAEVKEELEAAQMTGKRIICIWGRAKDMEKRWCGWSFSMI